jgi:hypothetical protein
VPLRIKSAVEPEALPSYLSIILIFLLSAILYVPSFDDFFVQDDFIGLSVGRAVATNPGTLFNLSAEGFPAGYRTVQVVWWALGWWLGEGSPMVFHVGQALILVAILGGIFIISRQLGLSRLGAIFGMWFFLLMPLLTESFYWLAANPLHIVFSLASIICFIAWLRQTAGHASLLVALVLAFLSCQTKEAGLWSFMALVAAAVLVPGKRGARARAWGSCFALAAALLYVALYLLLPYQYPSGTKGPSDILVSFGRLVILGWFHPIIAVRKAALEAGVSHEMRYALSVASVTVLVLVFSWASYLISKIPQWSKKVRCFTFTFVVGLAAALPYSFSAGSGWRYLTDIGVWVALCWSQVADPFVAKRRAAYALILVCILLSLFNIMATREIRSAFDKLGHATYMLCADIKDSAHNTDRYLVMGFPEHWGHLRVWHVPKLIRLCDPSVLEVKSVEEVPRSVSENTAVLEYSHSSFPDSFYRWVSPGSGPR